MEQNRRLVQEDIIDLKELFATLKKRKKLIGFITLSVTLLAIVYAFFIAKPIYEAKAMIEIGTIDDKPIDKITDIKEKLIYKYNIGTRGKRSKLPRVTSISIPKKSGNIIAISSQGANLNQNS